MEPEQEQISAELKKSILEFMEDNTPPTGLQTLYLAVWSVLVIVLSVAINGVALKLCWDWFMVPMFALPSISVMGAIGISIVGKAFVGHKAQHTEHPKMIGYKKTLNHLAEEIKVDFGSAMGLVVISWIVSRFI
jgi:hypothetical protein